MNMIKVGVKEYIGTVLPEILDSNTVYRLLPVDADSVYYRERTDRNIGWITPTEQEILHTSVVGIAGVGGMGGLLAATLLRAGIGEIRISDCETFDVSNINRQFAATRSTIGKSKVFETARLVRSISNDMTLVIYPQGITEDTVSHFVDGCSVICDEIELLAIDARILLHRHGIAKGISLFNCNTVGFSTNLFLYTPTSMTMEDAIGLDYTAAKRLSKKAVQGNKSAASKIAHLMLRAVVPTLPEYRPLAEESDHTAFYRRLIAEKKVPIIASNPLLAAGFLADRIVLYLLRDSGVPRSCIETPEMPGYLHLDAAHMHAVVETKGYLIND
jgi:tRNA A37 threonylcarbamoyladenosine dehydratase